MEHLIKKTKCRLKERLDAEQYEHSIVVADIAVKLAQRFSIDIEKAYLAGLLHDCGKEFRDAEIIDVALLGGISVNEVERTSPRNMLHAQVGAYIAQRDYGITDSEILQAIAFHQSGGIGMTALDKIIGLADGTEPSRDEKYLDEVKEILKTNLDKAYLMKYTYNMVSAIQRRRLLDSVKAHVYNYLILQFTK